VQTMQAEQKHGDLSVEGLVTTEQPVVDCQTGIWTDWLGESKVLKDVC